MGMAGWTIKLVIKESLSDPHAAIVESKFGESCDPCEKGLDGVFHKVGTGGL